MKKRFVWVMMAGVVVLLAGCNLGRPVPGFTFSPEGGTAPLSVQFANTSTGGGPFGIEWSWDFGDGTPADASESPVHVYAAAGEYAVTLTMKTWRGDRSTVGGPVSVAAAPDPVPVFTVDFSASPTVGVAPLTTRFANVLKNFRFFKDYQFIHGSDAHQLEDMAEREYFLEIPDMRRQTLIGYLG